MWPNPRFPAILATFTEKFLMKNFFLCAVSAIYFKLTQNMKDIIIVLTTTASFTLFQIFEVRELETNLKF